MKLVFVKTPLFPFSNPSVPKPEFLDPSMSKTTLFIPPHPQSPHPAPQPHPLCPTSDVPFGGRVTKSLHLKKRPSPYVIKSDLTIMPKAEVVIDPGVELQFHPNIGILVLGKLDAQGTKQ